jgi:hypothetical protein
LFADVGDGEHGRMISGASQTRLRCGTPPPRPVAVHRGSA